MGQTGFIFQEDTLDKYNLNTNECFILDWLIWFMDSEKQDHIQKSDGIYYWVKYSKVIADTINRTGIRNEKTIAKVFTTLCTKHVLLKCDSGKNNRRRLYFRFCDGVKEELKKGANEMKLLDVPVQTKGKTVQIHQNVYEILKQAKTFFIPPSHNDILQGKTDKIELFPFKMPKTNETNKSNIAHFNRQVMNIFNGTFDNRNCKLNPEFLKKESKLIDEKETWKRIKECRGDWEKVTDLIYYAMAYYKMWFELDREPLGNKKFLYRSHRDIGKWMYDPFCGESYFMACILRKPMPRQDKIVQKLINSLPDEVYRCAKHVELSKFLDISEDAKNKFWLGVNDVYKAEKKLDVAKKEWKNSYSLGTWLGDKDGDWTCKYLEWLDYCYSGKEDVFLKPHNIGINSHLWEKWLSSDVDIVNEYGLNWLLKATRA